MIKKYKITNIRKNNYTWYRWYSVIEDIDIFMNKNKKSRRTRGLLLY